MKYIYLTLVLTSWVAGIVIAKGFLSTLIAIYVPLWAWYLVVEKLLYHFGVL